MNTAIAICPVCGFDPNPAVKRLSAEELWRERIYKIFMINAEQPWWVEQTKYVCQELKQGGLDPKRILDVGCGDGRWIYGVRAIFPRAAYTGIDRLEDHIFLNRERFPEVSWIHNDFCVEHIPEYHDTIFLMGVFNPIMQLEDQDKLLNKITRMEPDDIIILFDYNSTGHDPHPWLAGEYNCLPPLKIPKGYHGPNQNLVVFRYVKR